MWAMLIVEPAGNPPSVTAKFAVAAVMFPDESFVVFIVIVAVPVTDDSALVIGGTSLAGDSDAVKIGVVLPVVGAVVEDELPQPAVSRPSATATTDRCFICDSP